MYSLLKLFKGSLMKNKKVFILIVILTAVFIFGSGALCNSCNTAIRNTILKQTTDQGSTALEQQDSIISSDTEDSQKQLDAEKEEESIAAQESTKLAEEEKTKQQETATEIQTYSFNDTGDDRFVLSFNTTNPKDDTTIPTYAQVREYYLGLGIPETNLFTYWGWYSDGGTYENFVNAINSIASKGDENSVVYINILSHGSGGPSSSMEFANGEGNQHYGPIINYSDISKMLDKIKCSGMVVVAHSCALATAVEPLTANPAYPRVAMAPVTEGEVLLYIMEGNWNIDKDNDGKISVLEIYNFLKDPTTTANPARYTGLEMIDNFNIAKDIFLK